MQQGGIGDEEFASILKLKDLDTLGLCGGPISERGLARLGQLPNLRILFLEYNRAIKDGSISKLRKLRSLEQLWISNTNISDKDLASLVTLPNLRFIDLSDDLMLTDKAIDAIALMPRLEEVRIGGCANFTKKRIAALTGTRLDLRVVTIVDDGTKKVSERPKADLYYGKLDPRATKFVQRANDKWESRAPAPGDFQVLKGKSVDNIVMWYAKRNIVKELIALPVKSLNIGGCDFKSHDYAQLAKIKGLNQLSIVSSQGFSDDDLYAIASNKQLRKLSLKSTDSDCSIKLPPLLQLKDLVSLDLCDNISLGDATLECIAEFPKLEDLNLANTNITSKGLLPIANIKYLKTLDISGNKQVRDEGLQYLFKARNLRLLRCYSCSGITPGGQRMLRSLLPKLEISTVKPDYVFGGMIHMRQARLLMQEGAKESVHVIPKFLGEI